MTVAIKNSFGTEALPLPLRNAKPFRYEARWWCVVFVLLAVAGLRAAPVEGDLGYGLVYMRVHELPADLPPKPAGRAPPCVLDLRYVKADADAAAAALAWVKARATPRSPVFVLANRATAAALREPLSKHPRATGVAVVGVPDGDFQPQISVATTAETERRAYDALERGVPIAKLLKDNPDKVRNDEASLSRDRLAEASADAAGDALAGKAETPPIDATLQRAVHLHRALVALKRI